jgi:hypothetical protein
MNLYRDENRITIGGGVSSSDGTTVLPLKVDPVTGRLIVAIDICTDSPIVSDGTDLIDENRVQVSSAVREDNNTTFPLHVCSTNNFLALDIVFE